MDSAMTAAFESGERLADYTAQVFTIFSIVFALLSFAGGWFAHKWRNKKLALVDKSSPRTRKSGVR
jgi:cation transport ATPase